MKPHLDDIDLFLKTLETARDDDELRRLFETYQARYASDLPKDPDSDAYRDRQFELYEHLYGKPYSTEHEHTPFDVATIARTPFPYSTGSSLTVGNQLIAIGYLIKAMALPKGARILEFGPGWGNTTIALGRMGYEVTAVDIEPNFVELLRLRARAEGAPGVSVQLGDFLSIKPGDRPYDAILFFECFHHCADHLQMIAGFDQLLSQQGLVCFAGEPITPDFPLPWGLRMDGESLWAIRKNGWLELGFNLDYFESTMARHGWRITQQTSRESPWASVLLAHRSSEPVALWSFGKGQLHSLVGTVRDGIVHADGRVGYLMHGPYAAIKPGRYTVQLLSPVSELKSGGARGRCGVRQRPDRPYDPTDRPRRRAGHP
jgi:protein-L-isoaspartate O-methyltransferase